MKLLIKSAYLNNPEQEIDWLVKAQIQLVRSKCLKAIGFVKNLVQTKRNVQKEQFSKSQLLNLELAEENELLKQYYFEGMKLFNQGKFAPQIKESGDKLGIFL